MSRRHEEWLQDLTDRQRNIVFPDTAANEARFWRNLFNGTRSLSGVQFAGIAVLAIALLAIVFSTFIDPRRGFSWQKTLGALISWILAFALLGGFLIVFRFAREWERRRGLESNAGLKHADKKQAD
jgi:ABC-type bacteriocin/lantibiotic exporter with double-glycine peptidase domain